MPPVLTERPEKLLDKTAVANLTPTEIAGMNRSRLVQVVRVAGLPFLEGNDKRLNHLDREVLQRLACLSRRCCRN